jgi:membrane associated rhomboid family serine protease
VAAVWGAALVASLVPHGGISWQGHLCGGLAGVLAAWLMSGDRRAAKRPVTAQDQLERALAK